VETSTLPGLLDSYISLDREASTKNNMPQAVADQTG